MSAPPSGRRSGWAGDWLWLPSIALFALAAAYVARGAHFLLTVPMPSDITYRNRWMMELWHRQLP